MQTTPGFEAAITAARAVEMRFLTASDDELLADAEAIEELGRLVDGWRVGAAAQIAKRADRRLGEGSLAFRRGARNGAELVAKTTRIGYATARARVAIGSAVAPRSSLFGDPMPGRYPAVADALEHGAIGVDSARVVTGMLQSIRKRVCRSLGKRDGLRALEAAERELVVSAATEPTEQLRLIAGWWRDLLDPDGAESDETRGRGRRGFVLGPLAADGTFRFRGTGASAEDHALIKELLESRRRVGPFVQTPDGGDDDGEHEDLDGEWRQQDDPRSRTEQDYDTVLEVLRAGASAEASGTVATATTHEIVVHATLDELAARRGSGWIAGVAGRVSIPTIERLACDGGIRLLITDPAGEPLHLGRTHRLFSAAQKKALNAVAHGRCEIPGCTVPHPFLQAHHVEWFERDVGGTEIGNGIMVCSYHHHLIHATDPPFELRVQDGGIYLVPKGWIFPPTEQHRIRRMPRRAA